jgi:hypothetical protein
VDHNKRDPKNSEKPTLSILYKKKERKKEKGIMSFAL